MFLEIFRDFSRWHEIGAPRLYRNNRYIEAALCKSILLAQGFFEIYKTIHELLHRSKNLAALTTAKFRQMSRCVCVCFMIFFKIQFMSSNRFDYFPRNFISFSETTNISQNLWRILIQSFSNWKKIDSKKRISTPSLQKLQYLLVPKFGPISFVPLGLSSCRNLSIHLRLAQSRKWGERDFSLHFSSLFLFDKFIFWGCANVWCDFCFTSFSQKGRNGPLVVICKRSFVSRETEHYFL